MSRVSASRGDALEHELGRLLGAEAVLPGTARGYSSDQTEGRGVRGQADAIALPSTAEEARAIVAWCYEHEVAIVPRGGGSGFAGGAVPTEGGVVVALERMKRIRSLEPLLWRMEVEAGVRTADVHRLAMENGLRFPPDPGAAEQSQIGGNVATNAGGPHAFKYGTTGSWVTGLEAVIAPGELIRVGGRGRKDVAGYDLKSLLIGSEGTLGLITAAQLRLIPAPETNLPVIAFYPDAATGCAALEAVLGNGLQPAALDYLDAGTLDVASPTFPAPVPEGARFLLIAEADGSEDEAHLLRDQLADVMGEDASGVHTPASRADVAALWRWRDGVSLLVTARRGGKVSEDITVPVERLAEAIEETVAIGRRHGLEAVSWGHAGDGNLHSTMLVDPSDEDELERARAASADLLALATGLGGSVTGEHGLGFVRSGELERQWGPPALDLHERLKRTFDPKGLMNPGKKGARVRDREPDALALTSSERLEGQDPSAVVRG
jgi:glycolate oxidase subunit GlcD